MYNRITIRIASHHASYRASNRASHSASHSASHRTSHRSSWGCHGTYCEDVLQRSLHSTKCIAGVAISKHSIINPLSGNKQSVMMNTERCIPSGAWEVLGQHWTDAGASLERNNGLNKMKPSLTLPVPILWQRQRFGYQLFSRRGDIFGFTLYYKDRQTAKQPGQKRDIHL